jgi:gas vesicle protein
VAVGGMTVGDLVAYLKVDDDDFNKKTDAAEGRFGKLGGVLKTAGVAAGAAAFAGLGAILHTGMQEAMDASAAQAQLEAGIKSTGGAAGVTVGHLNDLASEIQNYSGQTDDSIAQTEALLLTFTNIKNAGPDKIFDQATIAAADMAAKMGTDAPAAAIQLGKALNDPVKGVTALTRMGVQFTDGQKAQIAALVESGDVMGAQKIILGELETQFGGAAKAAGESLPGKVERGKRAFEDMSQNLVSSLMPALVDLMGVATNVMQGFDKLPGPVKAVVLGFVALAAGAAILAPLASGIGGVVAVMKGWAIATKVQAAGQWLLNAALSANPIGLVVVAIAGLVAAVVIAWKKSETFRKIVIAAWNAIKAAAKRVFDWIASFLRRWVDIVRNVLRGIGAVVDWVRSQWNRIKDGAVSAFNAVVDFVRGLPGRIKSAVGGGAKLLYNFGADILRGVWNGMSSIAGWLKDRIYGFFKDLLPGWAKKALGIDSPSKVFAEIGRYAGLGLAGGLDASQGIVAAAAKRLVGAGIDGELRVTAPPQLAFAGARPSGGAAATSIVVQQGAVQVSVSVGDKGRAAEVRAATQSGAERALVRLAQEIRAQRGR